jgi:transcriptional regulator with XRE-family HTH domain
MAAPTTDTGSTVPRRQLGRYLRQLREKAGITVVAAAEALEWSGPRIWRVEKGMVPMRVLDVLNMCEVYDADPHTTETLVALAKETRARGWWHSYNGAIPKWFDVYIGLEAAASRLRTYEPELVPGLLQTEAYATEVIRLLPGVTDDEVAKRISLRRHRQRLLLRAQPPAPQLEFVLNEAALRRPLRPPAVHAAQLRHLAAVSAYPNLTLRVLPLSAGLTRAVLASGSFAILDFPPGGNGEPGEPTTVYCADGLTGALYLDQRAEVEAYEDIWSAVVEASLSAPDSRARIIELAEES